MITEAIIVLANMRGGCATVGSTVHTLFRVNNRRSFAGDAAKDVSTDTERAAASSSPASA